MKAPVFLTFLTFFAIPLAMATPQDMPYEITTYEEVSNLLEEDKQYYGVVFAQADDPDKTWRFVCMSLLFVKDPVNKRMDYMYKGWNMAAFSGQAIKDTPCEFLSEEPTFIENRANCVTEDAKTSSLRQIDLSTLNLGLDDPFAAFRSISFSLTEDYVKATTPNVLDASVTGGFVADSVGHAMGRCNPRTRKTLEAPVFAANMRSMTVAEKVIPGAATDKAVKTLTIRLDLSMQNNSRPEEFSHVDYVIMLEPDQN